MTPGVPVTVANVENVTGGELDDSILGDGLANVLKGRGGADTLEGRGGNDTLDGGSGADTLRGGADDDTYRMYNSGDVIVESTSASGGTADPVAAAVDYVLNTGVGIEIMATNGPTGASGIDRTGNALKQSMTGNAGSNILDGKGGSDTLTGLGGKDFFLFSSALGASNVDTITDFNPVDDTIRLENAVFTALTTSGTLSAAAFRANTTGLAGDASDLIIYETDTGKLFYDADGNGAGVAIQFATVSAGLALTNADFSVV